MWREDVLILDDDKRRADLQELSDILEENIEQLVFYNFRDRKFITYSYMDINLDMVPMYETMSSIKETEGYKMRCRRGMMYSTMEYLDLKKDSIYPVIDIICDIKKALYWHSFNGTLLNLEVIKELVRALQEEGYINSNG